MALKLELEQQFHEEAAGEVMHLKTLLMIVLVCFLTVNIFREALKFLKNGLYNAIQIKYRIEDFKKKL